MASVTYDHVTKNFDGTVAVKELDLEVADGEFMVLGRPVRLRQEHGARGCSPGWSRSPTGGSYIGDRVVNNVAPQSRDIAMVFQSYALYPHMTVYDNLAFGLRNQKVPKKEIDARVRRRGRDPRPRSR